MSAADSMLRALLFDLDGTLMDHDAARATGLAAHVAERLPDLPPDELARLDAEWRRLEAIHYDEYAAGRISFVEQRRRRVRGLHAALGDTLRADRDCDDWFAGYLTHYRAAWRPFDDVSPTLEMLANAMPGLVLGVITNGEGSPQRAKLAAIGLATRFPVVVCSADVGVAKPDPGIFEVACERLGARIDAAAYVGDRLDVDAQGAADAGLHGIWLDRHGASATMEISPGVTTIASLSELPEVLSREGGRPEEPGG